MKKKHKLLIFFALSIPLCDLIWVTQGFTENPETRIPPSKIEQAVISTMPVWHGRQAQILDFLDLTRPFTTRSQWSFVVAQDSTPPPPDIADMEDNGPIAVCLVRGLSPQCTERYGPRGEYSWYVTSYRLIEGKVVYIGPGKTHPLLWVKTCSASSADGNCDIRAVLYAYEPRVEQFRPVFLHDTGGSNNNENARFVEDSPLRGAVIVDYPTEHAPYTYWIEVYERGKLGRYVRILRYRGRTGYNDGNPLPVAYSEMPEIMRRLGLLEPGDPLPVPEHKPSDCNHLVMRHGEEWCQ